MAKIEIIAPEISPEKLQLITDEFEELIKVEEHLKRIQEHQENAVFRFVTGRPSSK